MKTIFLLAVIGSLAATAVFAGTIVGTVSAQGKTNVDNAASDAAYASRKYKFVEKVDYAAMRDFVVSIEGMVATTNAPSPHLERVTTTRVAQDGAVFNPHVLPIMAGTPVEWPNNDTIYHNVFSFSDAKQFDLGLYKGTSTNARVTFNKPGRVDVFCSIHKDMNCIVLVLENPYFAATDSRGHYAITNVPPGTYQLKAWHERLPPDEREITVPASGEVRADFVLGIKNLPQY
jgi:plastocyanin